MYEPVLFDLCDDGSRSIVLQALHQSKCTVCLQILVHYSVAFEREIQIFNGAEKKYIKIKKEMCPMFCFLSLLIALFSVDSFPYKTEDTFFWRSKLYEKNDARLNLVNIRGGSNSFASEWIKNIPHAQKNSDVLNMSRSPMAAMDELVGKVVSVALDEGIECTGVLQCCDEDFNVWLKGNVERRDLNTGNILEKEEGTSMFIRGNNVVHIGRVDDEPIQQAEDPTNSLYK